MFEKEYLVASRIQLKSRLSLTMIPLAYCLITVAAAPAIANLLYVDRHDDKASASQCLRLTGFDCSLRGAILFANQNPGEDTISIPGGIYTLSITGTGEDFAASGDLDIRDDLVIRTFAGEVIIDAADIDRVFEVFETASVEMNGITIIEGQTTLNGGGVLNKGSLTMNNVEVSSCSADGSGGGIDNQGFVEMSNSTIINNHASRGGGLSHANGMTMIINDSWIGGFNNANGPGGGIWNDGELFLFRSSIFSNSSSNLGGGPNFDGGGLFNSGSTTSINSTFVNNFALSGHGGAIFNLGQLNLELTTFSLNYAQYGPLMLNLGGAVTTRSTLFHGECSNAGSVASSGGNLESPGDTCLLNSAIDLVNIGDPKFGPLQYYGGPTKIYSLRPDSPAIDAAHSLCTDHDQRRHNRPINGDSLGDSRCDVGSYEYDPAEIFKGGFENGDTTAWPSTVD